MAKKPVHEIRLGRVKATVWENETGHGITRKSASFTRTTMDGRRPIITVGTTCR